MRQIKKHKVPLIIRYYRLKNTGFLTFTDSILRFLKPPKRYKGKPKKLLFVRTDRIGDALVTVPVLRDLKLNYPELIIDVLCSEKNKFIFEKLDFINKVHIFTSYDNKNILKKEKYDAVIDLVSTDKRFIRLLKKISPFVAGSRLFLYSWIYDYYLYTNWVSETDKEVMGRKIEKLLTDCFDFKFIKRDNSQPYDKSLVQEGIHKEYDLMIHLGTEEIRKLDKNTEENIIESLKNYKILITDGNQTERFSYYKNKYGENPNIKFKLYNSLQELVPDTYKSRLILCYDGGQAHFLSQFAKTITIFGPGSVNLWRPYEFETYEIFRKLSNDSLVMKSKGNFGHMVVFRPIWCSPCFDIGCDTRPCLTLLEPAEIAALIIDTLK